MRPFRNGKGSYDLIVPKFQKLADSRRPEAVLCAWNVYAVTIWISAEDVLHFADLGFEQISVEPVVAADTEEYAHPEEEDLPKIFAEYDKLAAEMVKREKEGRGFNVLPLYDRSDRRPVCVQASVRLRIGNRIPGGNTVGRSLPMPSVRRTGEVPDGKCGRGYCPIRILLMSSSAATSIRKEKCKNCFAKFYCSGGCAANSYNFHGTIQRCLRSLAVSFRESGLSARS